MTFNAMFPSWIQFPLTDGLFPLYFHPFKIFTDHLWVLEYFEPSLAHSSMHSVKSALCNIKEVLKYVTADHMKRKSSLDHSVFVLYMSGPKSIHFPSLSHFCISLLLKSNLGSSCVTSWISGFLMQAVTLIVLLIGSLDLASYCFTNNQSSPWNL